MLELPSIWNLVISTIVFFIVAWYVRRYLNEQGVPKGMTRGMLVFLIASLVSWGAGDAADWAQEKIEGPRPAAQTPNDVTQLLKDLGQVKP
jgi:hypothetical protein